MNKIELRQTTLLSLQRALLGVVPSSLRGLTCAYDNSKITIKCYFDGEISDENRELMECVATEVVADFFDHKVDLECIRLDAPAPLDSHTLIEWVYLRKE